MAIKFGDSLENQNANYPIIDLVANHAKGVLYVPTFDNTELGNIPVSKRAQGSVVIVKPSGLAYVWKATGVENADGWNDIASANWVPLGEAKGETYTVQIPTGQSFGKYVNGDTINASTWNAIQIIKDAITGYVTPTITIAGTTTPLNFSEIAQTGTHTVSFSVKNNNRNSITTGNNYKIASIELGFRYNTSTSSNWNDYALITAATFTAELTSLNTQGLPTDVLCEHTYSYTTTANSNNDFYFAVKVTPYDEDGAATTPVYAFYSTGTNSFTKQVTNYSAPTITSATQVRTNTTTSTIGGETVTLREKGNVITQITATVTRQSPLIDITGYRILRSDNGGAYSAIHTVGSLTASSVSIDYTDNAAAATVNSVQYKIEVIDQSNTTYGSPAANTTLTQIVFQSGFIVGESTNAFGDTHSSTSINALLEATPNKFKQLRTAWAGHTAISINNTTDDPATYIHIAYPDSVADITSILQDSSVPVLGAFQKVADTINVTNAFGVVVAYKLYVSNATNGFSGSYTIS
jgi:hypothetical protein